MNLNKNQLNMYHNQILKKLTMLLQNVQKKIKVLFKQQDFMNYQNLILLQFVLQVNHKIMDYYIKQLQNLLINKLFVRLQDISYNQGIVIQLTNHYYYFHQQDIIYKLQNYVDNKIYTKIFVMQFAKLQMQKQDYQKHI